MASSKNIFYNLYSTSNNVVKAGYECNTAVDEKDTSFDITVNSLGQSAGVITDSNGNTLTSIDLTQIHSSGLTQYNVETRILQPHSCYVLQGQEFGFACASYYYVIPITVKNADNYEYYLDVDFDVVYNNFSPRLTHIATKANGKDSFVKQVNEKLQDENVQVSVSLQTIYDNYDKHYHDYLVFLSQKEGYFYYVNNLKITLKFQSEDFPDSPFTIGVKQLKAFIYNEIYTFKPRKSEIVEDGEEDTDETNVEPIVNNTDEIVEDTSTDYKVDCDLFSWFLHNYEEAVKDIKSFRKCIDYLEAGDLDNANIVIQNTVYDKFDFANYDVPTNIEIIYDIVVDIKSKMAQLEQYFKPFYWLKEDKHMRIPLMKYPNGAFRGIVLLPDWSDKSNASEYASLWINHIKSVVKLYLPSKEGGFLPKKYGVLSNATLIKEERIFRDSNKEFGEMAIPGAIGNLPEGFEETTINNTSIGDSSIDNSSIGGAETNLNTDYIDPYRPDADIDDDLAWMGQNYYAKKKNVIGIFRYMQYVNDNNLWNKVGEAYMIIGKDDDPQSHNLNLPTSMLIYNPNSEPVRIKYMIFS